MIGEIDPDLPHATFVALKQVILLPSANFATIFEAWESFRQIRHLWLQKIYTEQSRGLLFHKRLQQWCDAFAKFVAAHEHTFNARDRQDVALLEMTRRLFEMFVLADESGTPHKELWNRRIHFVEEIVDWAAAAAGLKEGGFHDLAPFFAIDSGINTCVYTVVMLCRDPILRRKAIAVLSSANRQEGFWSGKIAAHLANQLLLHEEHGARFRGDFDVTERIKEVRIDYDTKEAKVVLRHGPTPNDIQTIQFWRDSSL